MSQKRRSARKIQETIALLQKNFECAICLDLMKNPVKTKCEHIFCRHCLLETIGNLHQAPCPLCKVLFTKRSLQPLCRWNELVKSVANLIQAFQTDTGTIFSPPRSVVSNTPRNCSQSTQSQDNQQKQNLDANSAPSVGPTGGEEQPAALDGREQESVRAKAAASEEKPRSRTRQPRRRLNVRQSKRLEDEEPQPLQSSGVSKSEVAENEKRPTRASKRSHSRCKQDKGHGSTGDGSLGTAGGCTKATVLKCDTTQQLLEYIADGPLETLDTMDVSNATLHKQTTTSTRTTRSKSRPTGKPDEADRAEVGKSKPEQADKTEVKTNNPELLDKAGMEKHRHEQDNKEELEKNEKAVTSARKKEKVTKSPRRKDLRRTSRLKAKGVRKHGLSKEVPLIDITDDLSKDGDDLPRDGGDLPKDSSDLPMHQANNGDSQSASTVSTETVKSRLSIRENPAVEHNVRQKIQKWFVEQKTPASIEMTQTTAREAYHDASIDLGTVEGVLEREGRTRRPIREITLPETMQNENSLLLASPVDHTLDRELSGSVDNILIESPGKDLLDQKMALDSGTEQASKLPIDEEGDVLSGGTENKSASKKSNQKKRIRKSDSMKSKVQSEPQPESEIVLFDLSQRPAAKKTEDLDEQCDQTENASERCSFEPAESMLKPVMKTYSRSTALFERKQPQYDASFNEATTSAQPTGSRFFPGRGQKTPVKSRVDVVPHDAISPSDPYTFKTSQRTPKQQKSKGAKSKKFGALTMAPGGRKAEEREPHVMDGNGTKTGTNGKSKNIARGDDSVSQSEIDSVIEMISEAEQYELMFSQQIRDMAAQHQQDLKEKEKREVTGQEDNSNTVAQAETEQTEEIVEIPPPPTGQSEGAEMKEAEHVEMEDQKQSASVSSGDRKMRKSRRVSTRRKAISKDRVVRRSSRRMKAQESEPPGHTVILEPQEMEHIENQEQLQDNHLRNEPNSMADKKTEKMDELAVEGVHEPKAQQMKENHKKEQNKPTVDNAADVRENSIVDSRRVQANRETCTEDAATKTKELSSKPEATTSPDGEKAVTAIERVVMEVSGDQQAVVTEVSTVPESEEIIEDPVKPPKCRSSRKMLVLPQQPKRRTRSSAQAAGHWNSLKEMTKDLAPPVKQLKLAEVPSDGKVRRRSDRRNKNKITEMENSDDIEVIILDIETVNSKQGDEEDTVNIAATVKASTDDKPVEANKKSVKKSGRKKKGANVLKEELNFEQKDAIEAVAQDEDTHAGSSSIQSVQIVKDDKMQQEKYSEEKTTPGGEHYPKDVCKEGLIEQTELVDVVKDNQVESLEAVKESDTSVPSKERIPETAEQNTELQEKMPIIAVRNSVPLSESLDDPGKITPDEIPEVVEEQNTEFNERMQAVTGSNFVSVHVSQNDPEENYSVPFREKVHEATLQNLKGNMQLIPENNSVSVTRSVDECGESSAQASAEGLRVTTTSAPDTVSENVTPHAVVKPQESNSDAAKLGATQPFVRFPSSGSLGFEHCGKNLEDTNSGTQLKSPASRVSQSQEKDTSISHTTSLGVDVEDNLYPEVDDDEEKQSGITATIDQASNTDDHDEFSVPLPPKHSPNALTKTRRSTTNKRKSRTSDSQGHVDVDSGATSLEICNYKRFHRDDDNDTVTESDIGQNENSADNAEPVSGSLPQQQSRPTQRKTFALCPTSPFSRTKTSGVLSDEEQQIREAAALMLGSDSINPDLIIDDDPEDVITGEEQQDEEVGEAECVSNSHEQPLQKSQVTEFPEHNEAECEIEKREIVNVEMDQRKGVNEESELEPQTDIQQPPESESQSRILRQSQSCGLLSSLKVSPSCESTQSESLLKCRPFKVDASQDIMQEAEVLSGQSVDVQQDLEVQPHSPAVDVCEKHGRSKSPNYEKSGTEMSDIEDECILVDAEVSPVRRPKTRRSRGTKKECASAWDLDALLESAGISPNDIEQSIKKKDHAKLMSLRRKREDSGFASPVAPASASGKIHILSTPELDGSSPPTLKLGHVMVRSSTQKSPRLLIEDTPLMESRFKHQALAASPILPSQTLIEETPPKYYASPKLPLNKTLACQSNSAHKKTTMSDGCNILRNSRSSGTSRTRQQQKDQTESGSHDQCPSLPEETTETYEVGSISGQVADLPADADTVEVKEEQPASPMSYIDEKGRYIVKALPTSESRPVLVEDREFDSKEEMEAVLRNIDQDLSRHHEEDPSDTPVEEGEDSDDDIILPSLEPVSAFSRRQPQPCPRLIDLSKDESDKGWEYESRKEKEKVGRDRRLDGDKDLLYMQQNRMYQEGSEQEEDVVDEIIRPKRKSLRNVIEDDISNDEGDIEIDDSQTSRSHNLTSSSALSSQSDLLQGTEAREHLEEDCEKLENEIAEIEAKLRQKTLANKPGTCVEDNKLISARELDEEDAILQLQAEAYNLSSQEDTLAVENLSGKSVNAIPDSLTEPQPLSEAVKPSLSGMQEDHNRRCASDRNTSSQSHISRKSCVVDMGTLDEEKQGKSLGSLQHLAPLPSSSGRPSPHSEDAGHWDKNTDINRDCQQCTTDMHENASKESNYKYHPSLLAKWSGRKRKLDWNEGSDGSPSKAARLENQVSPCDDGLDMKKTEKRQMTTTSTPKGSPASNRSMLSSVLQDVKQISRISPAHSIMSYNESSDTSQALSEFELPARPNWCFVTSGMRSARIKRRIQKFQQLLGARESSRITSSVTHLIVPPADPSEDPLFCQRTLKYFQAIAARKWVVSSKWVSDSLTMGQLLPEDDYEIHGDTVDNVVHHGPRRSRLEGGALFKHCEMYCLGEFTNLTHAELRDLIEMCGGSTVQDPTMFSFEPHRRQMIIVEMSDDLDILYLRRLHHRHGVPILGKDWILDSVGQYKLQRMAEYIISLTADASIT